MQETENRKKPKLFVHITNIRKIRLQVRGVFIRIELSIFIFYPWTISTSFPAGSAEQQQLPLKLEQVFCTATPFQSHKQWCQITEGSGPPPLNSLTFRPVVGQLSEVVPFLLLEQRCGIACQAMLRRPHRCWCSRTGWRHTCSDTATKLFDSELHFFFLVIICLPEQWSLQ